ncbi:Hypothetical predicted protein, partial [Paramuricea clavata]
MPAKKKPDQEKLLFIRYESSLERCKSLIASAERIVDSCPPSSAASYFTKITSLVGSLTTAFSDWLLLAGEVEEEKINDAKKAFNDASMSADEILVRLDSLAPVQSKVEKGSTDESRLRRIDFRPLDKNNVKNWFEDLEVVFKAMGVYKEELKYASLLRLVDNLTSSLISSVTRANSENSYTEAKNVIVAEFS